MSSEIDMKGYCIDITSPTINKLICPSSNYLKIIPASNLRSVVCGGNEGNDKCAMCSTID